MKMSEAPNAHVIRGAFRTQTKQTQAHKAFERYKAGQMSTPTLHAKR
jgi:hypothetical protein